MFFFGFKVKGLSLFYRKHLIAQMQTYLSFYNITVLFSVMGLILRKGSVRTDFHQQRLHFIFLSRRHGPLNTVSLIIYFFKIILRMEYDLLGFRLFEKV